MNKAQRRELLRHLSIDINRFGPDSPVIEASISAVYRHTYDVKYLKLARLMLKVSRNISIMENNHGTSTI